MAEVTWNDYSDTALQFVYEESKKILEETFTSFRETVNKSYTAIVVYFAEMAYGFDKIAPEPRIVCSYPYYVLVLGSLVALLTIAKNLFGARLSFIGTIPSLYLQEYYVHPVNKSRQQQELIIQKLKANENAFNGNLTIIKGLHSRFQLSALIAFGTTLITGLLACIT